MWGALGRVQSKSFITYSYNYFSTIGIKNVLHQLNRVRTNSDILELQIVSEMLRVNTGSSCVFPSRLLGSSAVFRIVMRATNEGHCEGH